MTWPIALSIIFNVVYFKADTIILSLYYPAHAALARLWRVLGLDMWLCLTLL